MILNSVSNTESAGQGNIMTFIQIPKTDGDLLPVGTSEAYWFGGQVKGGTGVIEAVGGVARLEFTCATKKQIENNEAVWAPWDIADASSEVKVFSFDPVSALRLVVDSGTARVQITAR